MLILGQRPVRRGREEVIVCHVLPRAEESVLCDLLVNPVEFPQSLEALQGSEVSVLFHISLTARSSYLVRQHIPVQTHSNHAKRELSTDRNAVGQRTPLVDLLRLIADDVSRPAIENLSEIVNHRRRLHRREEGLQVTAGSVPAWTILGSNALAEASKEVVSHAGILLLGMDCHGLAAVYG